MFIYVYIHAYAVHKHLLHLAACSVSLTFSRGYFSKPTELLHCHFVNSHRVSKGYKKAAVTEASAAFCAGLSVGDACCVFHPCAAQVDR